MQKKIILFSFSLFFTIHSLAQVVIDAKGTKTTIDSSKWTTSGNDIYNKNTGGIGVGTDGAPQASAALEVRSTNKGLLISRLALTSATSASPLAAHVAGMVIYNTAIAGTAPNNVSPGFYYNDGTKWVKAADANNGDLSKDAWIDDNANTMVKLGTQSDGATARSAGTEVVVKDNGKVGIGTPAPQASLHVRNGNFRLENQDNWNAYKGATYADANYPQLFLLRARGTKASPTYPILSGSVVSSTLGVLKAVNAVDSTGGGGLRINATENQSATAHGSALTVFTTPNGTSDNVDVFIVDQNGNVGVGDMAPAQKLTVRGVNAQPTATASLQTNAILRVSGNSNHNLDFGTYADTPFGSYIQSHNNNTANGLPLVFNPTGGNVGVSTDNPQKKLHVNGALQVTNELNVGGNATTAGSAGSAGQYLTSNGPGAAPSWQSFAGVTGTSNGTVIAVDGQLIVAQEIIAQLSANFAPSTSAATPIGNLDTEIIDNQNTYSGNATTNSFTVTANGVYRVIMNLQLAANASGNKPVIGIWDNTNSTWVARVNDTMGSTLQTFTLITSINMDSTHTYSFRISTTVATVRARSSGTTGSGPVSQVSVKRLR